MSDGDSDVSSIDELTKRFAPLYCKEDFDNQVVPEQEALCVVVVTSFLCPHSKEMLPIIQQRFVMRDSYQTRRVRYFHVALVPENKTDIKGLLQKDPVYMATKRPPTELQKKDLQRQAYLNLMEFLSFLEVRSTPCMLFFVTGKLVRLSDEVMDSPRLTATGSSMAKWEAVLQNAVIRRNTLMREYDEAKRQERRRLAKERRREARRLAKLEEAEEDEEDY
ncbi:hypothetical protein ERJ75_000703300 [Trypanosoma vivax]|uniref:Thioredoxin-like fold domain-containing protein n=1 Tax=Trypanosoma vivax (strain Y486) TaxID=1055687 RepID=G0TU65_TRYVY|nr:hypothetical protein TRVL_03450 [Trypanosoma vivax]KAH8613644.1 hypothetical protein ERJ75_000703300 [Trypanosoma vivax]CCC47499.1 conserved hypothetical protein [Trypanosoma vivax Y486]